ncbi:MAG: hypothetical protein R3F11_00015 [Verrucomicrobiales bacterium]
MQAGDGSRRCGKTPFAIRRAARKIRSYAEIARAGVAALLAIAAALCAAGCRAPLPDEDQIENYHAIFRQQAEPNYRMLEARRSSGQLSDEEYLLEKSASTSGSLRRSTTRSTGIFSHRDLSPAYAHGNFDYGFGIAKDGGIEYSREIDKFRDGELDDPRLDDRKEMMGVPEAEDDRADLPPLYPVPNPSVPPPGTY